MPGYCVQGTVGHKILNGQRKLELEGRATVSSGSILHHINIVFFHSLNIVGFSLLFFVNEVQLHKYDTEHS